VSWWPGWAGWLTDQQEVCGTWVPVKQQCVICASDCDGCAREPFAVAVREKKINKNEWKSPKEKKVFLKQIRLNYVH
jgi:hypothetical protein